MDIPAYSSNIQPYGSSSGTKVASEDTENSGIQPSNSTELSRDAVPKVKEAEPVIDIAKEREKINAEERQQMVEEMNDFISSINKGLSFRVDKESGKQIVTVYEVESGDVIRQFPDAEMLKVYQNLATNHSGILVDKV